MWLKLLILATAFFCVACGNSDMGAEANLKAKANSSSSSALQNNTYAAQAALAQMNCKAASVYDSGDALFGQVFAGSSICYSSGNASLTQVKVSAYIAGSRYCLVPVKGGNAGSESCFTMNANTTSVSLQSPTYDALILVNEVYVSTYKSYLNGQSNLMPPLAIAALVH
ncbi:MAG: hypothetical protein ACXWQO_14295 [Bdellovibrionota bacterium]